MSIIAVVMLVFVRFMYANKESPNVTFSGGSPEFVTTIITVSSLAIFVVGVVGTFKPEVVVWATEAMDTFSMLEYLENLADSHASSGH
jgi:hypothetical protein